MLKENTEYNNLLKELNSLKEKALNTQLSFGKYKGKTIEELLRIDRQYVYWLIRDTTISIDPRLLNLKMPTKKGVLETLGFKYRDNKFIKETIIEAEYDDWNVGHYGCKEATLIRPGQVITRAYDFDQIIKYYSEELSDSYPFIKWTVEYLTNLFNN